MFKRPASAEIDESSETKVLNIRELMREGDTFRQAESGDGETSDNLRSLLGRVTETSAREVDNLIGELQRVREKLRDDGNRIQRDIEEYAALSQQVMKLTQIIAESLQKLPNASRGPSILPD
jgi:hypothetical protein